MKRLAFILLIIMTVSLTSCVNKQQKQETQKSDFKYLTEQFADLKILRYQVPGFEDLSAKQQEFIYYLSQAALSGRDIIYAQNGRYNLAIRRTLENIYATYAGEKSGKDWDAFVVYLKRVWFSNGIYHHYASDKFLPTFSENYFKELVAKSNPKGFPVREGKTVEDLVIELTPVMFDPKVMPKKVSLDSDKDLVLNSAVHFYDGVTEDEVENFYKSMKQPNAEEPLSFGINSNVVKENGNIVEKVWKVGGMYTQAIEKIVYWLEKALPLSETQEQKAALEKLIAYYKTGDLKTWDDYNVLWVKDLKSQVDVVNGFIETYEDPLGRKATFESVVNFKDMEATKRAEAISSNAQWFEDNSPVDAKFKKKQVKGVSAKVITVAQLAGDASPSTAIGINLPNADWIRKEHGSKSVTIENITDAYDKAAQGNGMLEEFVANAEERELAKKYGSVAGNVHTDLHECLGHGSGQLLPGTSSEALKSYQSTLEEARADLFALYYMMDQKMVDLKILPSLDAAKAEYAGYIRNGLITQLTRIEPDKNIEESHMRNRQLIAKWVLEKGAADKVVELVKENGKTYVKINDYAKLRGLFGKLLAEIQRIKSEGDYNAGKALVENYGVKVDPTLHKEVLERFKKLNIAPYSGFINPVFTLNGKKVEISYPDNFTDQMLYYAKNYSFLPTW